MIKLRKKILLTAGLIGITTPIMADTSYQCFSCPAGTYSKEGATSCTDCPAGKYSTGGASSCLACPIGTFSSARSGNCISCLREGVATCDSKTGKVTGCLIGYGLSNGGCTACSDGYYSTGGSQTCSNNWTLLTSHKNSGSILKTQTGTGTLDIGYYKIIVNGAGGLSRNSAVKGGNGDQKQEIIFVSKSLTYTYTIAVPGRSAEAGTSSFKIDGGIEIIAAGGSEYSDGGNGLGGEGCIRYSLNECYKEKYFGSVLIYKIN